MTNPKGNSEDSSETTGQKTSQDHLVTIDSLKTLRTRNKTKVTNTSKRLIQAIAENIDCNAAFLSLESSMSAFNDSHEEYCCIIGHARLS